MLTELSIPEHDEIVCGMSLGYAEPEAVENTLVTTREPVGTFMQFVGFD